MPEGIQSPGIGDTGASESVWRVLGPSPRLLDEQPVCALDHLTISQVLGLVILRNKHLGTSSIDIFTHCIGK